MKNQTNRKRIEPELGPIEGGSFGQQYLIYNRKSTDEAESQKNSIDYQRRENSAYARKHRLKVAKLTLEGFCVDGVISERHSGFKETDEISFSEHGLVQYRIERPKFQQLVQLLNNGAFAGVIFLCWDRASRNRGDDTILRKLMRNGVDIRFVYASYDKSSSGELHMDIDGMFAQHHSRVTSEKVTLSTRANRQKGICTYRAPIGYLNTGSMDHKPLDPERAPIIKELFSLYATGTWSLSDLARFANKQGMTTLPMRRPRTRQEMLAEDPPDIPKTVRPITESHVSRILTNPFYMGKILGDDGKLIDSISHDPIVGAELFRIVQSQLKRHTVSARYSENVDLPLRGFVKCRDCGRSFTPYRKKGHVYFGSHCRRDCTNTLRNLAFTRLADRMGCVLESLSFTDAELQQIELRLGDCKATLRTRNEQETVRTDRERARIQQDLDYLNANRVSLLRTGAFTSEALIAENVRLRDELEQLGNRPTLTDNDIDRGMQNVISNSELLKNLSSSYKSAEPTDQARIIRIVCAELVLGEDTFQPSPQAGFSCFFRKRSALGDPMAWISELISESTIECSFSVQ